VVRRQSGGAPLGRTEQVRERFYAISAERKLKHPAAVAISAAAHGEVFRARSP
jgi:LysR family transcriptional activator of nhaA